MPNLPSKTNDSKHSLQEREAHREWIGGRVLTLLSHYYRPDDPVELTGAIARDWADVLEGLPRDVLQRACVQYQRDEPRRKPTPGAIYQIARDMMPKPQPVPVQAMPREEAERIVAKGREINPERKAQAEAILRDVGLKIGGKQ